MELNLHANATTTPKIRAYIQRIAGVRIVNPFA